MKDNKKTYWKGIEQLSNDPEFVKHADKEFPEFLPINDNPGDEGGSSRRDFLKMMGFGIAAASLAACEAPIRKAIPYVNKPVDVDPGIPNFYATSYVNGGNFTSVVVKTREGRPIKIEGNSLSKLSQGSTDSQVQASVLTLYDNERLRGAKKGADEISWADLDKEITGKLNSIASQGGAIKIVSNTILSPTTKKAVGQFVAKFPTTEHITYDPISAEGMLSANERDFGVRAIPSYHFDKADVIVSFDSDFLGTWVAPSDFTCKYTATRKIGPDKKTMSRHYQYESNLSLTGSNADYRTPIKPSETGAAVIALYNAVAKKVGASSIPGKGSFDHIDKAANDLVKSRGKSIVISGSNDPDVQTVVNGLNNLLNSYGNTIDINTPLNYRQGNEKAMNKFIDEAKSGSVKAVIFFDCNPVYNHVRGTELKSALSKISLKVSTSARPDETAILTDYIAPNHHYLESWGDVEPTPGYYSFIQPTISPIFDTRQAEESFLKWSGVNKPDYFNYLKDNWQEKSSTSNFDEFWDKCLYSGVYEEVPASVTAETVETEVSDDSPAGFNGNAASAANTIGKNYKGNGVELALYQKVGLGDGSQANNPWLQELPDPITKATWDNYLTVSQAWASENNFKMVDANTKMAKLTINQTSVEIPILIQPGQAPGTVGLAFGYGRTNAGKVANERGVNAFPLLSQINGTQSSYVLSNVSVEILDADYEIARTQTHQTYMGRENVIQESVLSEYIKDPSAGRRHAHVATWMEESGETNPGSLSLWKGHKFKNHHWGLAIDLNTCTGCSACVISCHAENNVPVVGKQEVINRRDMHWLRIDRYYSSDASPDDIKGLEKAAANPEVTFQPMMCQQCNNAPCETVCPVAATTHSSEGLNQMTYNRCIGTRYCANNCPYKVRRFNWFKYHDNSQFEDVNTAMNNDLGKMVLNPDVTVRSRGVMEKCSMCVQKIQQGKLQAKIEGRRPHDEDFDVACASSCPTEGMVFGDMNDPNSKISKLLKIKDTDQGDYITEKEIEEPRAFHVLEEIGVKPNVTYLTKIRNKDNA